MNRAQDQFTLAVQQHAPTPGNVETSLVRLESTAKQARQRDAQLLVVPEASITGYNLSVQDAQAVAIRHDGSTTDKISAICQSHDIAIAYGFIETDGKHLYNTVQILNAAGNCIASYRKTHLWGELDRSLFAAGNAFSPVFELSGWNLGLLICYDIEFPESVRQLSLNGCELVLAPTALMEPWLFVAEHVTRVRAAENQLYFAYANYCGSEYDINYIGHSCIVGPDGNDIARAQSSPELLVSTLTKKAIEQTRNSLPYLADRRPELYSRL